VVGLYGSRVRRSMSSWGTPKDIRSWRLAMPIRCRGRTGLDRCWRGDTRSFTSFRMTWNAGVHGLTW